jgi:predicted small lipoprotein YifL
MTKKLLMLGLLVLATVGSLAGCGGTAATETVPADEVPVVAQGADDTVVAEGVIEPARWSELLGWRRRTFRGRWHRRN